MKMKPGEEVVRMRVICVDTLDPHEYNSKFGIQDKNRVIHEVQRDSDGNTHYDIEVRVKWDNSKKCLNFLGPWTNGPVTKRYLYLAWYPIDHTTDEGVWRRRIKVDLMSITRDQIDQAVRTGGVLVVRIPFSNPGSKEKAPGTGYQTPLESGWLVQRVPDFKPIQPSSTPSINA